MKKEKQNKNNKGFTLIELLVVVLIIGILAAISLPQYKMAVAKSRYSTIMALAKAIAHAQERYYLVNDSYALSFTNLDVDMPPDYNSLSTAGEYCYDWGGCNFQSGNVYCYEATTKTKFSIYGGASSLKGKIYCDASGSDTNNFSNRLCRHITGQNNPDHGHVQPICGEELKGKSYFFSSY